MDGNKTIGPLALRRIGEAFRRICGVPRKLPFRLHELVAQLRRATKEDDYRHNAAELMRLAEHAQSPSEKTHLVTLAEGWVELAEKAHKNNQSTSTADHPAPSRREEDGQAPGLKPHLREALQPATYCSRSTMVPGQARRGYPVRGTVSVGAAP